MSKVGIQWRVFALALVIWLTSGCVYGDVRLKRELDHLLQSLPVPSGSILLSETAKYTGGSDSRCDGYLVSRLYGTDEPIESVVEFVENKVLSQAEWAHDTRFRNEKTNANLISLDGYLLVIDAISLSEELLRDPLFGHEVSLAQPYKSVFLFNVVHIDSSQVKHCWGH